MLQVENMFPQSRKELLSDSIIMSKATSELSSAEVLLFLDNMIYPEDIEKEERSKSQLLAIVGKLY